MSESHTKKVKMILEGMLKNLQSFLKWVVDIGLNQDLAKLQMPKGQEPHQLFALYSSSQHVWLEHLSLLLDLFIKINDELRETKMNQVPEKIQEVAFEVDAEEELAPPNMARSISQPLSKGPVRVETQVHSLSLQIIKSLIQLLSNSDGKSPSKKSFTQSETSIKYLS
mmetsp:Transcript_9033/g.8474  ORF Transcript_9033/g.8474 Transcript_9033/m.8474 type:complete len:168 (-) Transcript_9033:1050-1553(-)